MQFGIHQANQKAAIVARVKIGVIHLQPNIARCKVEGHDLVIPEDASVANFEAIDRKREELFDRSLNRRLRTPRA